jgi:hypothetical protein
MMQDVPRGDHRLVPGTPVEVRTRYDGRWTAGFHIDTLRDGGYVLRRSSDHALLPVVFGADDLRPRART